MDIHQYIDNKYSIICANIRLTQYLKYQYSQKQLGKGLKSWETPDVLTWNAWVRRCWSDLRVRHKDLELLLNQTQEVLLWKEIIQKQYDKSFLWHIPSIARQAQSAWRIMKEYRIPEFSDTDGLGRDHQFFRTWSKVFKERCQQKNWIDLSSIPQHIGDYLLKEPELANSGIVLIGFDIFTPQQEELVHKLTEVGVEVIQFQEPEGPNAEIQIAKCMDISEEIRFSANWAKQKIQENSQAKIGILAPGLREHRQAIANTFEEVLSPGSLRYNQQNTSLPFSITLGRSLLDYPMIAVIFNLLALKPHTFTLSEISNLLRTPFIRGYEEERASRALLDERLRKKNQQVFTISDIKYHVAQMNQQGYSLNLFLRSFSNFCEYQQALSARDAPSSWSEHFSNMLEKIGWPGERQLNSDEQQQSEAWGSVLERLASIHVVKSGVKRSEAFSILRHEAGDQGFQHHTPESPIEIMDPQGATAMRFDHVWMLGMNENIWPRPVTPNPFIPIRLQSQYGVLHSDTQMFLEWTERLQNKIIRSSQNLIFSYSCFNDDRSLLGSPLLPKQEHCDINNSLLETRTYQQVIYQAGGIEEIADFKAPSAENHTGGTSIFSDQSQCPFRSFAIHRLHSHDLEEPDIGLSPKQRGLMVHNLMQLFWEDVTSHEELVKRTPEAHAKLIALLVEREIREAQEKLPSVFTSQFRKVEFARLKSIMTSWIDIERARKPFWVRDLEFGVECTLQGVKFRGRVDRIDELNDGSLVIIDYKTGVQSISDWAPERPKDPQLPLYAVAMHGDIAVIVFAIMRQGSEFGFRGLASGSNIFNHDTSNRDRVKKFDHDMTTRKKFLGDFAENKTWKDLLSQWRSDVEVLAEEFREGFASVQPMNKNVCQYCDQSLFCRIDEIRKNQAE
ncbi:MAG: exodeoxyribonuclease V subunit gamma [Gammaproteobacteria bacterium]|nr:exodeoxyribonuclease V subunit gamma [Gammaproteobacteria bacterium]